MLFINIVAIFAPLSIILALGVGLCLCLWIRKKVNSLENKWVAVSKHERELGMQMQKMFDLKRIVDGEEVGDEVELETRV